MNNKSLKNSCRGLKKLKVNITKLSFKIKLTRGFSLIELSVIISIAAAIAVGFMAWNNKSSVVISQQSIVTQKHMKEIMNAIENFRINYGKLPCPADSKMREDGTYIDGTIHNSNNFGVENLNTLSSGLNSNGIKT